MTLATGRRRSAGFTGLSGCRSRRLRGDWVWSQYRGSCVGVGGGAAVSVAAGLSIVDAVEPQIRLLLAEWPAMPATVIAERIGWTRSMTVLKERVRLLPPLFVQRGPVQRSDYLQGELAQCDLWFPPTDVPLGFGQVGRPPVLPSVQIPPPRHRSWGISHRWIYSWDLTD
jgi:hypothetical protein